MPENTLALVLGKRGSSDTSSVWMKLEDITLGGSQLHRDKSIVSLEEVSGVVRFIEMESRLSLQRRGVIVSWLTDRK